MNSEERRPRLSDHEAQQPGPSDVEPSAAPSETPDPSLTAPEQKDSRRGAWLSGAKTVFDAVETLANMIPVFGTYVGAVAKVGSSVVEMVQVSSP